MTYPATTQGLRAALEALGADADAVAQTLADGRHRGLRDNCAACPTAVYLLAVIDGVARVNVSRRFAAICIDPGLDPTIEPSARVSLPQPVRDFIDRFDDYSYPQLNIEDSDD